MAKIYFPLTFNFEDGNPFSPDEQLRLSGQVRAGRAVEVGVGDDEDEPRWRLERTWQATHFREMQRRRAVQAEAAEALGYSVSDPGNHRPLNLIPLVTTKKANEELETKLEKIWPSPPSAPLVAAWMAAAVPPPAPSKASTRRAPAAR